MSPVSPRRPGVPSTLGIPTTAIAVVASVVVLLAALFAFGVLDLSRFRSNEPSTEGLVAVPTPAAVIPAYTRIRRDHLWDRAQQQAGRDLSAAAGGDEGNAGEHHRRPRPRARSRERAGYVFTETDFLPPGTREGLVGGIPAGKRAIRISADKVEGLYGLLTGDRFDIVATIPISAGRTGGQTFNFGGPYSQEVALQAQLSNWDKQATVRVIVQSAVIVEPMATRGVPTVQTSLTDGAATRTRPVQEVVIAVEPHEVALLTEAMAVDAALTTIPRSGRPDDPVDSTTPDLRPTSPFSTAGDGGVDSRLSPEEGDDFAVVETIMGQKRALTAVPRP